MAEVIVVVVASLQPSHPRERQDVTVTIVGMVLSTKLEDVVVVVGSLQPNHPGE